MNVENELSKPVFVTGIGTEIGKTMVSAVLTYALDAHYWKPLQCGGLEHTDTDFVKEFTGFRNDRFFKETYLLKTPCSPHEAAKTEGVRIQVSDFILPETNNLIVEGCGGLMVPLNERETVSDLIQHLHIPVVVVVSHYLGSINHSLLTIDKILRSGLPLKCIILNGNDHSESTSAIESLTGMSIGIKIPSFDLSKPDEARNWVTAHKSYIRNALI